MSNEDIISFFLHETLENAIENVFTFAKNRDSQDNRSMIAVNIKE